MIAQYNFNVFFIDIINKLILEKNIQSKYILNSNIKYTINYILNIILKLSIKCNNRYEVPSKIIKHFELEVYILLSSNCIRRQIKKQILNDENSFTQRYIIVGVKPKINTLTIVI